MLSGYRTEGSGSKARHDVPNPDEISKLYQIATIIGIDHVILAGLGLMI